ncbi:hypothetical protein Z043_109137, partial [Scleropages formosus]
PAEEEETSSAWTPSSVLPTAGRRAHKLCPSTASDEPHVSVIEATRCGLCSEHELRRTLSFSSLDA